jgi:hypothetical protein
MAVLLTWPKTSMSVARNGHGRRAAAGGGPGWWSRVDVRRPWADWPYTARKLSGSRAGRPSSPRKIHTADTSTTPLGERTDVRRSPQRVPSPLQNVATVRGSPRRGQLPGTQIEVRRVTQERPTVPASDTW